MHFTLFNLKTCKSQTVLSLPPATSKHPIFTVLLFSPLLSTESLHLHQTTGLLSLPPSIRKNTNDTPPSLSGPHGRLRSLLFALSDSQKYSEHSWLPFTLVTLHPEPVLQFHLLYCCCILSDWKCFSWITHTYETFSQNNSECVDRSNWGNAAVEASLNSQYIYNSIFIFNCQPVTV